MASKLLVVEKEKDQILASPASTSAFDHRGPTSFAGDGDGLPTSDPWEKCYSSVKNFDDDLCDGWRDEVDKLLIFAGLFSATVTSFLLESYQGLSENPADKTNWLLEQLLIQTYNTNNANSSIPLELPIRPGYSPSSMDIRLNVFWFLSLALSLTTVVLAILCIQWLREFQRAAPLDPKDAISLRQIRYEGLVAWKVPTVLLSLPVLLHLSLILFFVGLLDLLWNLNHIVAVFVTVVCGIVLIFISVTTLLPGFQLLLMPKGQTFMTQCPYKSPQAWTFHRFLTWVVRLTFLKRPRVFQKSFRLDRYSHFFKNKDWVDFDVSWRKMRKEARKRHNLDRISDLGSGLIWIEKHLGQSTETISAIYRCIQAITWRDGLHVISGISEKIKAHLTPLEEREKIKSSHLTELERQDLIALLFLEQQTRTYPQLDDSYFQLLVNSLAAQVQKVDNQVALVVPFVRLRTSMYDRPKDLVLDYLRYLQPFACNGLLNNPELQADVWDLIHEILLRRSEFRDEKTVKTDKIAGAACELMAALVTNLFQQPRPETPLKSPISFSASDKAYSEPDALNSNQEKSNEQIIAECEKERIRQCVTGALQTFPRSHNFGALKATIYPILVSIDRRMDAFGGRKEVLDSTDADRWSRVIKAMRPSSIAKP